MPVNIDEITIGDAKRLAALFGSGAHPALEDHPYPVGSSVFIRSVTNHYTGKLVRVTPGELVLIDAAWIADDGRFSNALATGELNEIEPYPDGEVIINRGAISDVSHWPHALPRIVK